jgi:hypothetical protein
MMDMIFDWGWIDWFVGVSPDVWIGVGGSGSLRVRRSQIVSFPIKASLAGGIGVEQGSGHGASNFPLL